ncbi:TonB-dependent siderophore receptor [Pectobacterium carotovorum]|uniref:Ferrichrome-iron receptor n=2 Tax=Pectobacterium carotovorum TaxID=554 RepID=A0AA40M851_PECCC|nr:TonB-dependent receptor [Pectobacterium carotovorum]KAA3666905.1 TonB-dependent receptor [Pectobacterium carotovorum subsp. carotovorum]KFX00394.1 PupA [Pectobacterium carotovorum subsp. carotovorum]KML71419.1 PupA [Pectobacterium carotovorum subsp. carotovorum ICMP 5702]MBA0174106.1 TonB-dependent receptor [Pectobacterium carotovorum]MBB1529030.1 TonB-dependent receptor [Pectobacterium carotovorum subsp. carotovorum]
MKKRNAASPALGLSFKKRLFFTNMLAIHSALFVGATAVPMAVYAAGENDTVAFSIPAGDLQKGLLAIANQSKQTLSFNPALVANYQSAALNGNYSTRQAILRLLQGTPLLLTTTDNGTLTIVSSRANDAEVAQASDKTLPAITVNAGSEDETVLNPGTSSSALRTSTSLQQTAQSVQVISNKLINARQATSLEEALKNSASVVTVKSNRGDPTYWIRGYAVTSGSTDGLSGSSNAGIGRGTEIEGVERVEVLKGPQSVLAGSSSAAGSINVVRKKPVTEPLRRLKVEAARYGEFKTAVDLGGAITDDKSLSYRLNASTMKSQHSFPDYNGNHGDYLAPALTWQNDKTRITVGAEVNQARKSGPAGTIYANGRIQKLPEYRLGDKDDHNKMKTTNAYYELEQKLVDDWTFNSKAGFQSTASQMKLNETLLIAANGDKVSHPLAYKSTNQTWSAQNDFRGKIETGPVTQTLLVGHDYKHERYASYDSDFILLTNGNIYNPDSLVYPGIGEPNFLSYSTKSIQSGFLFQDEVDVFERLHFQLSVKHATWSNSYLIGRAHSNYNTSKWIPNYGVSFDITPDITAYANQLNSFSGSAAVTRTGEQLPPMTGKSREAGLKFNLLDDDLTLTTAVFRIEQNNLTVTNNNGFSIATTGRKSEGFDVDLNGTLLPGWDVSASYTYSASKDPESVRIRTNTPRHTGNIWTSYEVQSGRYQGLGASAGISGTSKTENGDRRQYFSIGSQASTDASVFYRQPDWSLTLGVNNVFDRDIYYTSTTPLYIGVKEGRTWRLTGTYSF